MKFIADVMLGKLAKRMRLRGIDVLYDHRFTDDEILRIAREQGRIVLTRDTELAQRLSSLPSLFIVSDHADEQLDQVLSAYPERPAPFTRCSLCNALLQKKSREEVRDLIPQHVHDMIEAFMYCSSCDKVYWPGSHMKRMERGLR